MVRILKHEAINCLKESLITLHQTYLISSHTCNKTVCSLWHKFTKYLLYYTIPSTQHKSQSYRYMFRLNKSSSGVSENHNYLQYACAHLGSQMAHNVCWDSHIKWFLCTIVSTCIMGVTCVLLLGAVVLVVLVMSVHDSMNMDQDATPSRLGKNTCQQCERNGQVV